MSAGQRILYWSPVAALLLLQAWLSAQSALPAMLAFALEIPNGDKLVHAGYFFLIGLFTVRAARWGEGWSRTRTVLIVLLLGTVYGLVDEFHQTFTPNRDSDPWDLVADVTGAACAALVGERLWRGIRRFTDREGGTSVPVRES